ncbi:MAG: DUF2892 domain-containing protein [Rhodospirillales bacterium]|nr:DUF2892 domain-containing protein [Rhodospirillales bacterium]MCB9994974.1 DUF2892 domain-containing protein [Rhodospirillales bacterium]
MEKNMGAKDKQMRLTAAAVLIVVGLLVNLGALESIMFLAAVVLIVTSLLNYCPAYTFMGKNTCGEGGSCCPANKCDKGDKAEEAKDA